MHIFLVLESEDFNSNPLLRLFLDSINDVSREANDFEKNYPYFIYRRFPHIKQLEYSSYTKEERKKVVLTLRCVTTWSYICSEPIILN